MNCKRLILASALVMGIFSANAQVAKMPIEFDGKHLYIKVAVGNNDSLRFVFDTGATSASIDSLAAENAGISKAGRQVVEAAGHGGSRSYVMVSNQTMKIAGLELNHVNATLVDFSAMTKDTGMKLDGLIGYELLERYVTGIDFDKKQMSFYQSIMDADTPGYTGIPFEFNKGILIPRFPVTITLKTGETFTGRVMFDSGGAFTLLVSTPYNKFHKLSEKLPGRILKQSRGMSAVTSEERAVIESMRFNGFKLGAMTIDLTLNDQAAPKDGYLGMIGSEIIKRFSLIIDYPGRKIYMKPNKMYRDPFILDTVNK